MKTTSTAIVAAGALALWTTFGACTLTPPADCSPGVCAPADNSSTDSPATFASAFADPLASSSDRSPYELDFGEIDTPDAGLAWRGASPSATAVPPAPPRSGQFGAIDLPSRVASDVDIGVRAALDPVRELVGTIPDGSWDNLAFGPADVGAGTYRLTIRRLRSRAGRFWWTLEARPRGADVTFSLVAGGLVVAVSSAPGPGEGTAVIDCNALAAVDDGVGCRGRLLIGFYEPDAGTKILNLGLSAYAGDPRASVPLTANLFEWRQGAEAVRLRVSATADLSGTATAAAETVSVKLTSIRDVGVRADGVAVGGDVPPEQQIWISSCAPSAPNGPPSTSSQLCDADGSQCVATPGASADPPVCPLALEDADPPNPDPLAVDPPSGTPIVPPQPTTLPTPGD